MRTLALILELISFVPAIQTRTAAPPAAAVAGTGTLLIAACSPGEGVAVRPGRLEGIANAEGVVTIQAPAQADGADPYTLYARSGSAEFHGTLSKGESLSAVCP